MARTNYWQRFQRQRISRRRLLAATGVGAAGLAVAAACGDDGGNGTSPTATTAADATATPAPTPVRGGTFKYGHNGAWGTIDPLTSVGFGPQLFPWLFNPLIERFRRKPDLFFFDLAESFEQPDAETYNYTIRQGVKIAPNDLGIEERDLDALDAKAWLDRITQETRAVHRAFTNQFLQSFEAADARTFQIKTNGPYAYFLLRLGAPLGGCIPPREFFEQDIDMKDKGVGAGPYVLRPGSFEETGGAILDRNTNYYRTDPNNGDAQLPYIDSIEAPRIDDRGTRRIAFVDRQLDHYDPETAEEVEDLRDSFPDLVVIESPANTFIGFTMNPTKPPWDDERIRKAALNALNRQEFVDIIVGGAGRPNGLVHWPLGDFALPPEELETLQPFNPEESKRLIREATGEDTISIKLIYPVTNIQFHDLHLPIFLRQMKDAGFDIQEDAQAFQNWLQNYQDVNYDASLSPNQIYEIPEVNLDFHASQGPQGDGNFAVGIGALFPEIDAAITDSKNTADADELVAKVQEVQRMIYDKGPAFLPIFSWQDFDVYHDNVKNHPDLQGLGGAWRYFNDWWLDA